MKGTQRIKPNSTLAKSKTLQHRIKNNLLQKLSNLFLDQESPHQLKRDLIARKLITMRSQKAQKRRMLKLWFRS
jgi:hypothetical protein